MSGPVTAETCSTDKKEHITTSLTIKKYSISFTLVSFKKKQF